MKDIPGYEGLYAINEKGLIWAYPKTFIGNNGGQHHYSGRYLGIFTSKLGYYVVNLKKDKLHKSAFVHRLIAITFIPNPHNLPCVNHMDGNKLNNTIENLEWCTKADNIRHAFLTGLMPKVKRKHDSTCTCFRCIPEHRRGVHKITKEG